MEGGEERRGGRRGDFKRLCFHPTPSSIYKGEVKGMRGRPRPVPGLRAVFCGHYPQEEAFKPKVRGMKSTALISAAL